MTRHRSCGGYSLSPCQPPWGGTYLAIPVMHRVPILALSPWLQSAPSLAGLHTSGGHSGPRPAASPLMVDLQIHTLHPCGNPWHARLGSHSSPLPHSALRRRASKNSSSHSMAAPAQRNHSARRRAAARAAVIGARRAAGVEDARQQPLCACRAGGGQPRADDDGLNGRGPADSCPDVQGSDDPPPVAANPTQPIPGDSRRSPRERAAGESEPENLAKGGILWERGTPGGSRGSSADGRYSHAGMPTECPWSWGDLMSTLVVYECLLHIPLGIGGSSIVAGVLGGEDLDPSIQGFTLLFSAASELLGAILFLSSSLKPFRPYPPGWFHLDFGAVPGNRGLLLAVPFGLIGVVGAAGASHALLGYFVHFEGVQDTTSAVESLLSANISSKICTYIAFVALAPLLEEVVYRGFLLASLANKLPLSMAIVLSSLIFGMSHPSVGSWLELTSVGCVLGLVYAWTGNLAASVLVHALFNALIFLASS